MKKIPKVTHLSFVLTECDNSEFYPGVKGLKRTQALWDSWDVRLPPSCPSCPAGTTQAVGPQDASRWDASHSDADSWDADSWDWESQLALSQAEASVRGDIWDYTSRWIVPDDEVRKPSIYHHSRDAALEWVDKMSEEVLASVGITGPQQTVQFNIPGVPPFFGAGRRGQGVVGGCCSIGVGKRARWGGRRIDIISVNVCIKNVARETRDTLDRDSSYFQEWDLVFGEGCIALSGTGEIGAGGG